MHRLLITSITSTPQTEFFLPAPQHVFLRLSSDCQRGRTYDLGLIASPSKSSVKHLSFLSTRPITVELLDSPSASVPLGTFGIYPPDCNDADHNYLRNSKAMFYSNDVDRSPSACDHLIFARRGASEVYHLGYVFAAVEHSFNFSLEEIRFVSNTSFMGVRPKISCQVEFDVYDKCIEKGPVNTFDLGSFNVNDSSLLFSNHNCHFVAYDGFKIAFYVEKWFYKQQCVSWMFIPSAIDTDGSVGASGSGEAASGSGNGLLWVYDDRIDVLLAHSNTESLDISASETTKNVTINIPNCGSFVLRFRILKSSLLKVDAALSCRPPDIPRAPLDVASTPSDDIRFGDVIYGNAEILIDGLATFDRYFHFLMGAQHSIGILAWELSLSFGLVRNHPDRRFVLSSVHGDIHSKWISLEDVLLWRALCGVRVRVMVWRHHFLSYLDRFLYLGEFTIEREVRKLQRRCQHLGLVMRVLYTLSGMPGSESPYASMTSDSDAHIVVIIVGNPMGIMSSYHEKLLIIDGECPTHAAAFFGGFDIARGRFDQPLHRPPLSFRDYYSRLLREKRHDKTNDTERYNDREVQPMLRRVHLLWHDIQVLVRGEDATRRLFLHFFQRWQFAFVNDTVKVKSISLPQTISCSKKLYDHSSSSLYADAPQHLVSVENCQMKLSRVWQGISSGHFMLEEYCNIIRSAKSSLYIEHQWPFQIFALTQCMCDTLIQNQNLYVIIVTCIKSDLPQGLIGDLMDASQDHISEALFRIYETAPSRVGVYGLVVQEPRVKRLRSIYVHSKLIIPDIHEVVIGSANMDNLSFFRSTELSAVIKDEQLARRTLRALLVEHLGSLFDSNTIDIDFKRVFALFVQASKENHECLLVESTLRHRPVALVPRDQYAFIHGLTSYPSLVEKASFKLGFDRQMAAEYYYMLKKGLRNIGEGVRQITIGHPRIQTEVATPDVNLSNPHSHSRL